MNGFTGLFAIGTVLLGACIGQSEPKKGEDALIGDLKAMQGKWKIVKAIKNGKEMPADAFVKDDPYLVFAGSKAEFFIRGKVDGRFSVKLDPKQNPKHIDWQELDEAGKVKRMKIGKLSKKGGSTEITEGPEVKPEHGLYELDGDRLKICMADERPKTFDDKKTSEIIWELERVKK